MLLAEEKTAARLWGGRRRATGCGRQGQATCFLTALGFF